MSSSIRLKFILLSLFASSFLLLALEKEICIRQDIPFKGSIIYVSPQNGLWRLCLIKPDGTGFRILPPQMDCFNPRFSPDGRYVVFEGDNKKKNAPQLFILDLKTLKIKQLTNKPTPCFTPAWSPDGRYIAYATVGDLFLLDLSKNTERRLTNTPEEGECNPSFCGTNQMVFVTEQLDDYVFNPQVYIMNLDGSNRRKLTPLMKGRTDFPACSPDSKRIAFVCWDYDESGDIFLINPDGTEMINLTPNINGAGDPAWSPDSKWVVFAGKLSATAGGSALFIIGVDGEMLRKITNGPADTCPTWGKPWDKGK